MKNKKNHIEETRTTKETQLLPHYTLLRKAALVMPERPQMKGRDNTDRKTSSTATGERLKKKMAPLIIRRHRRANHQHRFSKEVFRSGRTKSQEKAADARSSSVENRSNQSGGNHSNNHRERAKIQAPISPPLSPCPDKNRSRHQVNARDGAPVPSTLSSWTR